MSKILLFIVLFLLCFSSVSASTMTRYGSDFKIVGAEISYKVNDRLGSDRLTINGDNISAESNNLPYGQQLKNNDMKFAFTGKELDDTDNYYFNARYYDFDSGKFLGVDPVSDNHAYAYVSNNPMNYVDPSGMDKADVKKYKKYIKQRKSTKFGEPLVTGLQYFAYGLIPDATLEKLSEGRLRPLNFIMKYLAGKGGSLDVEYSKEEWDSIILNANKNTVWKESIDSNFPAEEGWEIASSFDSSDWQSKVNRIHPVWDILGKTSLLRKKTGSDKEGNNIYFYGIYGEDFDFVGGAGEFGTSIGNFYKGNGNRYKNRDLRMAQSRCINKDFYNFIKEKVGGKEALETLFTVAKKETFVDGKFGYDDQIYNIFIDAEAIRTHGSSIAVSAYIDGYVEEPKE